METTNGKRPKLELGMNQEARLTLLKDKCYEGTNSYGEFHLYSVAHDGEEKAFFATPEIHRQILEHVLRAGDQICVRKVTIENGKKMGSKFEMEVMKKSESSRTTTTVLSSDESAASDGLKALMERCVREAVEITGGISGVAWQNEDIQKISSCLFIARSRAT